MSSNYPYTICVFRIVFMSNSKKSVLMQKSEIFRTAQMLNGCTPTTPIYTIISVLLIIVVDSCWGLGKVKQEELM